MDHRHDASISPPRLLRGQAWQVGLLLACLAGCTPGFDPQPHLAARTNYQVTIHRDVWGVPHVFGKTDADAAFGLAYAQAEDHWSMIEAQMPFYRGTNARYNGPDAAVTDYLVKLLRIPETVAERYTQDLSPATRAFVRGFADGLNYYAAKHPEVIAEPSILPITEHDVVAGYVLRHLLFFGFESAVTELTKPERARPVSERATAEIHMNGVPVGSNAFAVAPHFAEDSATRLAINSHQPTTGPVAWYEAHIRSEEGLDVMGGLFPGSPTVSLGFTPTVAWAATVNRPDLVDIFVLDMHPEDEHLYRLDGEWQALEVTEVDIDVRLWGWLPWSVSREALYSAHGPALRTDHGVYAIRYAGHGEIRQVEQWYRMDRTTNVSEWLDVMRMASFASFNFVAADRDGRIAFVHNSLTPLRAPGYNWDQYLPGDDTRLIWNAYLPFDALPLVVDPRAGFVHSANQTPFQVTTEAENPQPEQFPAEAGFQTQMTNRAWRGLEMFAELGPISAAEFSAIKHDKFYSRQSQPAGWVTQMLSGEVPEGLEDAIDVLQAWDLGTDVDNRHAALGVCFVASDWEEDLDVLPRAEMEAALGDCATQLQTHFGRLDPTWGEVNRHVRGPVNVPIGGGPDILRAVYGRGLEEDGFLTNVAGDGLYYLVSWSSDGTQTVRGTHHFGAATLDEASPHYADQAEAYAREELRDPLFTDAMLNAHLERSYTP